MKLLHALVFGLGLLCVLTIMGGCGVARAAELHLLAAENAPLPPASKTISKHAYTFLVGEPDPTIIVRYLTHARQEEIVAFYAEILRRHRWTQFETSKDLPDRYYSQRGDTSFELEFWPKDGETEVRVTISTHHPWERLLFCWVQYAIMMSASPCVGYDNPALIQFVQLF